MKVLCAVDGSEYSHWAVEALGTMFHQSLKEVVLLHVVDDVQLRQGMKKEGASQSKIKKVITAMNQDGKQLLKQAENHAALGNQSGTYETLCGDSNGVNAWPRHQCGDEAG